MNDDIIDAPLPCPECHCKTSLGVVNGMMSLMGCDCGPVLFVARPENRVRDIVRAWNAFAEMPRTEAGSSSALTPA